jgi:sulfate adenylyltransferase subunit 2
MSLALPDSIYQNLPMKQGVQVLWDSHTVLTQLQAQQPDISIRTIERAINEAKLVPTSLKLEEVRDEAGHSLNKLVRDDLDSQAKKQRQPSLVIQLHKNAHRHALMANDGRLGRKWMFCEGAPTADDLKHFLEALSSSYAKPLLIWPHGEAAKLAKKLVTESNQHTIELANGSATIALTAYNQQPVQLATVARKKTVENNMDMTHLDRLEAESIHIIREVMAESENPVMMYSIGKDSAVMLRLAQKAFYPSKPPFPLLHVDTRWKFQAMYAFRDRIAEETGMDLIVHINPEGVAKNMNPFDHGSALHTDVMKTQGLIQALDKYGFDAAFGGARRDEEKSRAKERVFSFRNKAHRWDPKTQRPELWNLYNGRKSPGESIRVFPISNWTELDIWQYIYREEIPIVPLYYAAERPVIERDGMLMLVDDDRLKLFPGEKIQTKRVRFRTLGCYPLTGAVESEADDLPKILLELLEARTSERQGRAIDTDSSGSMEKKKQEGYF